MRAFYSWLFAFLAPIIPTLVDSAPTSISWSSPANDLSATGQRTASQRIALSADGTKATAIWTRGSSTSNQIVQSASATISGNSASWSAPIDLSGLVTYGAQVSLSSDGTKATAVWREGNNIKARSATITGNNAVWGSTSTLSSYTAQNPVLSLSSDGSTAIAVWEGSLAGHSIIQASTANISGNLANWATPNDLSLIHI